MAELKDWLNSINQTKNDLRKDNPDVISGYVPYVINKCLAGNIDCVLLVNEVNMYPYASKDMQYDFLLNSIRKKKRFAPWIKHEKIPDLENIMEYYGYSYQKAEQAIKVLTKDQLEDIKQSLDKGGF